MQVDTKNAISEFELPSNATPARAKEVRKASAQDVAAETARVSEETLKKIQNMIEEFGTRDTVSMHYDHEIDKVVVTVANGKTGEVTRQIPSAEFVSFLKNFDQMLGLMINRRL